MIHEEKKNTQMIKEPLTAGYFLWQTLIAGVGQWRIHGAQPHGEVSGRRWHDGGMTRWVGAAAGGP